MYDLQSFLFFIFKSNRPAHVLIPWVKVIVAQNLFRHMLAAMLFVAVLCIFTIDILYFQKE